MIFSTWDISMEQFLRGGSFLLGCAHIYCTHTAHTPASWEPSLNPTIIDLINGISLHTNPSIVSILNNGFVEKTEDDL